MRGSIVCSMVMVGAAACGGSAGTANPVHAGTLTFALSANTRNGDAVRLRNAIFDLAGCSDDAFPVDGGQSGAAGAAPLFGSKCVDMQLSTESYLDQAAITQRVLPGSYGVMLEGDWYLEQQTNGAWTRVDKAVLLSPTYQQVHVYDGNALQVSYLFGVGSDDPIDFRHGDLGIGIQVERPGDHQEVAGNDMAIAGAGLGSAGIGAPAGNGAVLTGGAGTQAP